MAHELVNEYGKIVLSNELLAMVAGSAAVECFGVVGMASHNIRDGIGRLLGRESIGKGVEIETENNALTIKVHIIVAYGTKISVIADNIIQKVRYAIEESTGASVANVQVIVENVRLID